VYARGTGQHSDHLSGNAVGPIFMCKRVKTVGELAAAATIAIFLFSSSALAADPLSCTDKRVLERIQENLRNSGQNAQPPRKFSALKEPREVLLGAPPRSANQYATKDTFIAVSRYCEGRAEFSASAFEPVYWRIDLFKEGASESSRIDVCHKLFDQFEDGCKAYRPGS
jgi:hypothetical protein